MATVNLEKSIQPGTFRWIGQRVKNLNTLDIPIGAISSESVIEHTRGILSRVGQISLRNAFVVECEPLRLLYVRRDYRGYRRAGQLLYNDCGWKIDYDHALGSRIAAKLGYNFVLLIRLTPKANRSHGYYEKNAEPSHTNRPVCFADRRIIDKWLGRPPRFLRRDQTVQKYTDGKIENFGLTLKQLGVWGFAMGVNDSFAPVAGLHRVN